MACDCCKGACCESDGSCTQKTKLDCESGGGTWHGNTTPCEDYDCTSGCCEDVSVGSCTLSVCRRGYTPSCTEQCDPDSASPPPTSGVIYCKDGTPTSVTVTGSGATFNTGDPALDAALDDMINASYAINFECNGTHDGVSTDTFFTIPGGYVVRVGLVFQPVRVASITAFYAPASPATRIGGMERNDGLANVYSLECDVIYECDLFSGAVTSSAGSGDYTGASIDVS